LNVLKTTFGFFSFYKLITFVLIQQEEMERICLMLGSNLGDRIYLINKAIELIGEQVGVNLKTSAVFLTEPWGTDNALPYLNLALSLSTDKTAVDVLSLILSIEAELGRIRNGSLNAPRTIDIDIVFYGKHIVNTEKLILPHPRMHLRRFVLQPLSEIEPDFIHPVLNLSVAELLNNCTDNLAVNLLEYSS
jgi:2-amino-4-hydroxy-6-hydroxymethyldihydropteridine diphosphokinase